MTTIAGPHDTQSPSESSVPGGRNALRRLRVRPGTTIVGALHALPLSDEEWRVEDPVKTEREGFGLVGFIQKRHGLFEVTRLGRPLERGYFTTLTAAIASLS